MKCIISFWSVLAALLLALALVGAGSASPTAVTTTFSFNIGSAYGDSDAFLFRVTQPGCILAQIKPWSRSGTSGTTASRLTLTLNGSNRTIYAKQDGSASTIEPLWTSYSISAAEVKQVTTWTISAANFTRSGTARGIINVEYPITRTPCELRTTLSKAKGRVDLSWRYTGSSFRGSFLIERSTDGRTWSVVKACAKSAASAVTGYTCTDTGLVSGKLYYYRACAIVSGSSCGTSYVTPATSVRAL